MLELFDYINLLGIFLEIIGFLLLLPKMTKWIKHRIEHNYTNEQKKNIQDIKNYYQDMYIRLNNTIKFEDGDDGEILVDKLETELKELNSKPTIDIMYYMYLTDSYRNRLKSLNLEKPVDVNAIKHAKKLIEETQNYVDEYMIEQIHKKEQGIVEIFGIILVIIGLSGQGISVFLEKVFMS